MKKKKRWREKEKEKERGKEKEKSKDKNKKKGIGKRNYLEYKSKNKLDQSWNKLREGRRKRN